jgi:hypothetical protein
MQKIVPIEMLTSMLLEPSSGSKHTMYLPVALSTRACSSSSLATIAQRPERSSTVQSTSLAKASSFWTSSP